MVKTRKMKAEAHLKQIENEKIKSVHKKKEHLEVLQAENRYRHHSIADMLKLCCPITVRLSRCSSFNTEPKKIEGENYFEPRK